MTLNVKAGEMTQQLGAQTALQGTLVCGTQAYREAKYPYKQNKTI